MLQRWVDHEEVEHVVKDDYLRNRTLIDLTQQPDDIKEACRAIVSEAVNKAHINNVGIHFMKFASKHNLIRLTEQATDIGNILNSGIKNTKMIS